MAGRMGTERGETVRTLDKAPWVRTDHHSGRYVRFETAKSGAGGGEGNPFSSQVCGLEVYDQTRAPGGAAEAGGHTARPAARDGTGIEEEVVGWGG